jgi:hypothetical protein
MPKASQDYNLYVLKPNLIMEWHPTKNGNLHPRDVTPGSGKKVWWLCEQGHEWQAAIYSRSRGSGCPICHKASPNNNGPQRVSATTLNMEWHPTKNGYLRLEDANSGLHQKVWWICKQGHEWQATVKSRMKGSGCPRCDWVGGQKRSSIKKIRRKSDNVVADKKSRSSKNAPAIGPAISDTISDTDFRKDQRFIYKDTVMLESPGSGNWCYAQSINISREGMFFESEIPFKAGTRIIVQFNHAPFEKTQKIYPSVVRWCKELEYADAVSSYGVGVKFI